MHFDDGTLTIVFDNYFVNGFDDPKGRLLGFYFIETYQDILTNIIDVIHHDIEWLLNVSLILSKTLDGVKNPYQIKVFAKIVI